MNNIKKHKRLIAAIVVILLAVLVRKNIRLYFLLQKDFIFRCSMCRGILKMKSSMI